MVWLSWASHCRSTKGQEIVSLPQKPSKIIIWLEQKFNHGSITMTRWMAWLVYATRHIPLYLGLGHSIGNVWVGGLLLLKKPKWLLGTLLHMNSHFPVSVQCVHTNICVKQYHTDHSIILHSIFIFKNIQVIHEYCKKQVTWKRK